MPPNINEKRLELVAASESTQGGKSILEPASEGDGPSPWHAVLTTWWKRSTFYLSVMINEPRMKYVCQVLAARPWVPNSEIW